MSEHRYLLDTNICIYLLEGRSETTLAKLHKCDRDTVVLSAVVAAEILIGAQQLGQKSIADKFLAAFPVLPFDTAAAQQYSKLPFKRGNFDRLIGAHALSLGLTLVTNNEDDFSDIPGLRVENWTV